MVWVKHGVLGPWMEPRSQIGNPEGEEKPNKKYYDPRACIRSAEESTVKRPLVGEAHLDLVTLTVGKNET